MADPADVNVGEAWTAVAGAGHVTVTPHPDGPFFGLLWAEHTTIPEITGGRIDSLSDRPYEVEASKHLYLRSLHGSVLVTVHRATAPA